MGYSLFLSHNAADIELVQEVKRRSEAAGVTVYTYEEDVRAGTSLAAKLTQAIRQSDGLVAILTKNGASRPAIQQEIGVAVALGKTVYALVEPGVDPATLTLLQGIEFIRLELDRIGDALVALQKSVTFQRSKQTTQLLLAIVAVVAIIGLIYVSSKDGT